MNIKLGVIIVFYLSYKVKFNVKTIGIKTIKKSLFSYERRGHENIAPLFNLSASNLYDLIISLM